MEQSVLSQFLKSGYVFEKNLYHTDKGTPQGGIISPILSNMTLDGIEALLSEQYPDMKVHFIRYADDFLVTAPSKEVAEEISELIQVFLCLLAFRVIIKYSLLVDLSARCTMLSLGTKCMRWLPSLEAKASRSSFSPSTFLLLHMMPPSRAPPLANFAIPLQMLLAA